MAVALWFQINNGQSLREKQSGRACHVTTAVTKQLSSHSMTMLPDYHHLVIKQTSVQQIHFAHTYGVIISFYVRRH